MTQLEQMTDDHALLNRYATRGDADAFATLVRRHIGVVHAAARRQTVGTSLADDVTQAAFIVLARKAASIRATASLPAWLFAVTRRAAQNAMKIHARRRAHESRAARMRSELSPAVESTDDALHAALDEAIARLPHLEQAGILLHFFHHQTHEQTGAALGLSADAARKRITRALEKMKAFLAGRGVVTSTLALAAAARSDAAVAVAPAVVDSTINIAILSTSTTSMAGASALIAQGVTRMYTLAKMKAAALVAVGLIGVGGIALPIVTRAGSPAVPVLTVSSSTLVQQSEAPKFTVDADDKTKVEFLGVAPYEATTEGWWAINGEPIEAPPAPFGEGRMMSQPPPEFQMLVMIHKPRSTVVRAMIPDAQMVGVAQHKSGDGDTDDLLMKIAFTLNGAARQTSLRIGIADEAWKTLGMMENLEEGGSVTSQDLGDFTFSPLRDENGSAAIDVSHGPFQEPVRVVAINARGDEIESHRVKVQSDGQETTTTYGYDISARDVKRFAVQTRTFTKYVDAKDVSLAAGNVTEPKLSVERAEKK